MLKKKWAEFKKLILFQELTPEKVSWSIAVALGSIFLPLPGIQLIALLPLCLILRVNIPIVYVVNWINNPFTLAPITFFSYWLGGKILKILSLGYVTESTLVDESQILSKIDLTKWSFAEIKKIPFSEIPWDETFAFLQTLFIPYLVGSLLLLIVIPLLSYPVILRIVKKIKKN